MPPTNKPHDNPYFKNGIDYSWQAKKEFNDLVKDFRDKHALSPNMKDARLMHTTIINELMRKLKEKPLRCSRLEYTGSAYEGVKVSKSKEDDDLEFDIMVIIEGGRDLTASSQIKSNSIGSDLAQSDNCSRTGSKMPPGYVLLQPSEESEMQRFQKQTTDGYVSADKVASHFMGQLSSCIDEIQMENSNKEDAPDELRHIKDNIVLRKHGPAIQMDVFRSSSLTSSDRKPFYSVDMVPTFEMVNESGQKEYYVAKPLKGVDSVDPLTMKFAWRRSFSLDEKDRLVDMDKNNTCKKAIFRMLKVIRNRECGLALLTSYHLKTVLLRELEKRPDDDEWKEEHIGNRLMDVISRLVSELGSEIRVIRRHVATASAVPRRRQRKGKGKDESTRRIFRKEQMPHLFIPQINLLDSINDRACACIYYRLKHLKNSEKQMKAILNGDSKPRRKNKNKAVKAEGQSAVKSKTKAIKHHTPSSGRGPESSLNQMMKSILNSLSEAKVNSRPNFDDTDDDDDDCDNDDDDIYAGHDDVDDDIDYSDMFDFD